MKSIILTFFVQVSIELSAEEMNPKKSCKNTYLPAKIKNALPNKYDQTVFCARNPNLKEATCRGDSGKLPFSYDILLQIYVSI